MAAKPGKKFCVEHGGVEQAENETERTPCPYDPKHTCYLNKLRKHMKKCNSRPKELPGYITPGLNVADPGRGEDLEDETYPISSVPDEVLLELVNRIERAYLKEGGDCERRVLSHPVVESFLRESEMGGNARKHLVQNSSLLMNMEENGFFGDDATFVEFGAGRGQLGFWISRAVETRENCRLVLIDRASHRHKSDNKLKGVSPVQSLRIRADIGDVDLSKISLLSEPRGKVFGVTKHLCGIATDLAIRCVVRGSSNGLRVGGVAMALCCHHRCKWSSFAGKKYLEESGFDRRVFSALCSISSWATCGTGKPRAKRDTEEEERSDGDRYKRFGLDREAREEIGRKCKMILNRARLRYLEEFGYEGKLVYYVEQNVSPENVCLIAKRQT